MPTDAYKPIACADYDIYEIAIMQKRCLLLQWTTDQGEVCKATVRPLELKIIEGAEYLFYEVDELKLQGKSEKLRLDKISLAQLT